MAENIAARNFKNRGTFEVLTPMVLNTVTEGLLKFPKENLKKIILHSDRGSQFTSKEYKETLKYYGITQSVSLAANPRDNAVIDVFLEI